MTPATDAAREAIARLLCSQHGGDPDAVASEPYDCWEGALWTAFTNDADAVLALTEAASQPREGDGEPFGYWVEQKHADPVLLRKPAYIPEPSDLRTVTPLYALTQRPPEQAGAVNARDRAIAAMRAYVESAGVPIAEFDPGFVIRMMAAMMVSFHKYGRVADAYPLKFDAASDVRARMKKYRETGNRHYLVDAANFAMIEAMHPSRASEWAGNDAADSPGRTTASGHRLVQEDNAGNRIIGETILHVPGDEA